MFGIVNCLRCKSKGRRFHDVYRRDLTFGGNNDGQYYSSLIFCGSGDVWIAGLWTIETIGDADPGDTGFEYSRLFRDLVGFAGVVWTGLEEQSVQLICQRKANSVIRAFELVFGVRGWTKSLKVECEV